MDPSLVINRYLFEFDDVISILMMRFLLILPKFGPILHHNTKHEIANRKGMFLPWLVTFFSYNQSYFI